MKIQKCNTCKTKFHNRPWIDECPVCRSKDINHNGDSFLLGWQNYGDINFMEHGGYLVKEDEYDNCFHVISLTTSIPDYKGKYKNPMIVTRCYVDVTTWLYKDAEMHEINKFFGNPSDFIPKTLEEKMQYAANLINYYGIAEFDPDFPEETGCSYYGFTWDKIIVDKTIAQKFLKECGVPYKWRK